MGAREALKHTNPIWKPFGKYPIPLSEQPGPGVSQAHSSICFLLRFSGNHNVKIICRGRGEKQQHLKQ